MRTFVITFAIAAFAGACSVFVPRIGALLAVEDMARISFFPVPFVILGVVYAAIVGGIIGIMYQGETGSPRQKFVAALGVPALFAGALTTSSQISAVNSLQAKNSALAEVARKAERIEKFDTPFQIIPLPAKPVAEVSPGLEIHEILGIGTARADETATSASQYSGLGAVKVEEPLYAIVAKAVDAQAAVQAANKLKLQYPSATAIKTPTGFGVWTGSRPESSAVLEAVKLKQAFRRS